MRMAQARAHLQLVCKLYKQRAAKGKYYMHEHPAGATSWEEKCVNNIQRTTGGIKIDFGMCMFGLMVPYDNGEMKFARKPTTILTNMPAAKTYLARKCSRDHDHQPLQSSAPGGEGQRRTALAQVYPTKLVHAILRSVIQQKIWDRQGVYMFGSVDASDSPTTSPLPGPTPKEEEESQSWEYGVDDVTGSILSPKDIRAAREDELQYYRSMKAFEVVPTAQALSRTGKQPIRGTLDRPRQGRRPSSTCPLPACGEGF